MTPLSSQNLKRRIAMANHVAPCDVLESDITKHPDNRKFDTGIMFRVRRGAVHCVTQLKLSMVDVYHINNGIESKRLDKKLEV